MKIRLFVIAIFIFSMSCDIIFEHDISGKEVEIVSPVDHAAVDSGVVTFSWRSLDGADRYRVTVVSPSFGHASRMICDTVMIDDSLRKHEKIAIPVTSGSYQWSIRASNNSYSSRKTERNLTVR